MRKYIITVLLLGAIIRCAGQSPEARQLLLNWEKLAQFKQMLADMKKGYEVLHNGYSAIRDISEGNFSLHKGFLDALLEVSPAVRNYKRIAAIVSYQLRIVKECKAAIAHFKESGSFPPEELDYLSRIYANLFKSGINSLEDLLLVTTAGRLRMSDDERLRAIDKVYEEILEQYHFLQSRRYRTEPAPARTMNQLKCDYEFVEENAVSGNTLRIGATAGGSTGYGGPYPQPA
jgi:hypothetical protein